MVVLVCVAAISSYYLEPRAIDYISTTGASFLSGNSLIIYDGEGNSASLLTDSSRQCLSYAEETSSGRNGGKALKLTPDQWHSSGYSVNCGGQDRQNYSSYSYLEFYIKSTAPTSEKRDLSIVSYYGQSATVNITSYIDGGISDTQWRLVSIPLSDLKTSSYDLSTVDTLYFGADTAGIPYYVDDIAVRKVRTEKEKVVAPVQVDTLPAVAYLYDGESSPLLASQCISYAEEMQPGKDGGKGLRLLPDQWHAPGLKINCGGRDRLDLSSYQAIEFYAKLASASGNNPQFNVVSYYGTSKTVAITDYVDGGKLDDTWHLVSIPIADLTTSKYNLSTVDDLYFGTDPSNRPWYIDSVVATMHRSKIAKASVEKTPAVVTKNDKGVFDTLKDALGSLLLPTDPKVAPEPLAETFTAVSDTYDMDEVDLANKGGQWLYAENNTHISLNFDTKFDVGQVTASANYTIRSSDDTRFAQGVHPMFKGYRWRTIYAPTIRLTDLKVAYHIFLELPFPLQNGKTYTVSATNIGTKAEPFTFTYNDHSFSPNIKVNQVGYVAAGQKLAYVGQYMGTGGPMPFNIPTFTVEDSQGKTVYTGTASVRNVDVNNTGQNVYELDFSALKTNGSYKLYVPGVGTSYMFRIGNDVYNEVLSNAMKGAYQERSGTELTEKYTRFTHGPSHMQDAFVMNHDPLPAWFRERFDSQGDTSKKDSQGLRAYYPTSLSGQHIVTTKGHYDAGDYGKYVVNGSLFVGNILAAYDAFPQKLMKDDLQLPESGDGVPDILEEAKWELDWLENMQDPQDGGVFCIVKPDGAVEYYENRTMDAASPSKRLLYPKDTTCTAHYAAALAKAASSSFIKKYYPDASDRYLAKAEKAWTFLEKNSGYLGWHHYGVKDEFDTDKSMDERVWASIELYNATGNSIYKDFFLSHHKPEYERWGWNTLFEASGQADYACAFSTRSGIEQMKDRCRKEIIKAADSHVKDSQDRAYRLSMSDAPLNYRDFTYFFPQERIIQLLIASAITDNKAPYLDTAINNWNYVLGANPTGYSFVTGIGSKRFREVVSTQSVYDGIKPPVPGLPIGMGNNFGYLEVYASKLGQMFPPNNAGSADPKVSYPLLEQVYDGWNIGVEFTIPEIAENIISAAYFSTENDTRNVPPSSAIITADKVAGSVPLTVHFKGSGVDDSKIVRYFWDFDDESYSTQQNPTHIFTDPYKVYNVVLTVTDNDGAEKFTKTQIRTSPQTFAFVTSPYETDAATKALFHFDSNLSDAVHSQYSFVLTGAAQQSSNNLLWMNPPHGNALYFGSVNDSAEVTLPAASLVDASNVFSIEAKMYIEESLAYNTKNVTMLAVTQGDDKAIGLYDAEYVDGMHVTSMNGYSAEKNILTQEKIASLMKEGKMNFNTWYTLKFVIMPGKTQVYVNNNLVSESDVSPAFGASNQPIKITLGGFKGYIDELRVSSTAR